MFYPSKQKNKSRSLEKTKSDFFKFSAGSTHYLEKKTKDNIPLVFPSNHMHNIKCLSLSEKNRFVKLTKIFSDLKCYIENNEYNDKELIKEVKLK